VSRPGLREQRLVQRGAWPRWVRQKRATRKPASCANPVAQKSQRLPICAQNAGGRNQI